MNLSILLKKLYREHWALILTVVLSLIVLNRLWSVVSPFLAAALISYLISSPATWIARKTAHRINYPVAAVLCVLIMLIVLASIGLLLVPVVLSQIELIQTNLPALMGDLIDRVVPFLNQQFGLKLPMNPVRLRSVLQNMIFSNSSDTWTLLQNVLRTSSGSVLGITGFIALVFTATLFMAPMWPHISRTIYKLTPPRVRRRVVPVASELDQTLSDYLKGVGVVVTFQGMYYAIALSLAGLNAGWAIGLLAGVLSLIPYIGMTVSMLVAVFSAVLDLQGSSGVLIVLGIFAAGQFIEGFILTPFVVGDRIGLSALSVMFSLTFFGALFGLVGVIFALPMAACIRVLLIRQMEYYRQSAYYRADGEVG